MPPRFDRAQEAPAHQQRQPDVLSFDFHKMTICHLTPGSNRHNMVMLNMVRRYTLNATTKKVLQAAKLAEVSKPAPKKRGRVAASEAVQEKGAALMAVIEGSGNPRERVVIAPPKFQSAVVEIVGTTPLVLHKFSQKVQDKIKETQEAGQQAKKGRTRAARDFSESYEGARHIAVAGWDGIPASAFRNALISACRTVGFKMTLAKLSLFVKPDGFDEQGTPLVKITKGEPHMDVRPGRNANGSIDLRARPMWPEGWRARPTLRWDADQFSANDVINLLSRAGAQVGVGEGRPDSKMSAGCGWGEFEVVT